MRNAPRILFWTHEDLPPTVLDWNPDEEPALFADGFGHNVLELYARMKRAGCDVHVGRRVPRGARVVVFLPSLLERRAQLSLMRELVPHRRVRLLSIRSDFLSSYRLPVRASLEVMPNRSSLTEFSQTWIPPLPQRGLVRRGRDRGENLVRVTYKGYPENLPVPMRTPDWTRRLLDLGFDWDPDVRDEATGHNRWHDFSQADVALCLRGDGVTVGLLRKPATKLINAWCAGAIPLVGREPSYLELAKHREDAMVVESAEEVISTLAELRSDPALVRRLQQGGAIRAAEFSVDAILASWTQALTGPLPSVPVLTPAGVAATGRVTARFLLDAARGDARSPIWRPDA